MNYRIAKRLPFFNFFRKGDQIHFAERHGRFETQVHQKETWAKIPVKADINEVTIHQAKNYERYLIHCLRIYAQMSTDGGRTLHRQTMHRELARVTDRQRN